MSTESSIEIIRSALELLDNMQTVSHVDSYHSGYSRGAQVYMRRLGEELIVLLDKEELNVDELALCYLGRVKSIVSS